MQCVPLVKIRRHILATASRSKDCSVNSLGDHSQELLPSILEVYQFAGWCFIHFCSSSLHIGVSTVRQAPRAFHGSDVNKVCLNLSRKVNVRGQRDLWVEWVLPQEEDRLYYTLTYTESKQLIRLGAVQWVSKRMLHFYESPRPS